MKAPLIQDTTREERLKYVQTEWECMHNCELCGKCHMLHGQDAEVTYADYIEGSREYMEITFELRRQY